LTNYLWAVSPRVHPSSSVPGRCLAKKPQPSNAYRPPQLYFGRRCLLHKLCTEPLHVMFNNALERSRNIDHASVAELFVITIQALTSGSQLPRQIQFQHTNNGCRTDGRSWRALDLATPIPNSPLPPVTSTTSSSTDTSPAPRSTSSPFFAGASTDACGRIAPSLPASGGGWRGCGRGSVGSGAGRKAAALGSV
jgi:hypothetical protein